MARKKTTSSSKAKKYAVAKTSTTKTKANKYFDSKKKAVDRLAREAVGPRRRLALQLVEMARVAQKLKRIKAWRPIFDKRVPKTRAGSAVYLSLVQHYLSGPAGTMRRYADAIELCVRKKWSRDEIRRQMLSAGPTKLSKQRAAHSPKPTRKSKP